MENRVETKELIGVLEEIRSEKYPDIPAELIEKIVQAEIGNQDEEGRGEAYKLVKNAIDEFLKEAVAEGENDA